MTTRNSNMWATPVKAPDAIKAGPAYEYVGRNWKASPDDEWETVIVKGGLSNYVGFRTLDGRPHAVFLGKDGRYIAQMMHYVTNASSRSGWEVLHASPSQRGGLHVQGINHETTDPLSNTFSWEIGHHSLSDDRFDFSHTDFAPGAKARLEQLRATHQRSSKKPLARNSDVDPKMNEANIARWLLEKPTADEIQAKLGVDQRKAHRLAAFGAMASVRGMGGLPVLRRQVTLEMMGEPIKRFVRNPRMQSLTFGILPTYNEFLSHVSTWKNEDGEGIDVNREPVFKMELSGDDYDCGKEAAEGIPNIETDHGGKYANKLRITIADVAALWAFISSLIHHADDAFEDSMDVEGEKYLSLASSIMSTLGYEWI